MPFARLPSGALPHRRPTSSAPAIARRDGQRVKVRHPHARPFDVNCRNAHVARDLERAMRERSTELRALPPERFMRCVEQLLARIDAARWQAEKRVRGTRLPRWGGAW